MGIVVGQAVEKRCAMEGKWSRIEKMFYHQTSDPFIGRRIKADPTFDCGAHGTHVCGTIASGMTRRA